MGLLRFIFLAIFLLWIIKAIARLLLPLFFQSIVSKAQQQANNQPRNQDNYNRRPEGNIHIDYIPPKDKEASAADKAGDFIDFEEIK